MGKGRKRKPGRPKGTGSHLTDVQWSVRGPPELMKAAEKAAELEGVSTNEWVRRAMGDRLKAAISAVVAKPVDPKGRR